MTTLFKSLILAYIALIAFGYWLPYFDSGLYSDTVNEFRTYDGFNSTILLYRPVEIGLFALNISIPFMLLFFVPWSRRLYVIYLVGTIPLCFAWGLRITTPLEAFIGSIAALIEGALLVMIYLTSLSERFDTKNPNSRTSSTPLQDQGNQ